LDATIEGAAADHLESNIGTGKTTTRKRSTSPAFRRERHRVRLPMVRIDLELFSFISRTAATAS